MSTNQAPETAPESTPGPPSGDALFPVPADRGRHPEPFFDAALLPPRDGRRVPGPDTHPTGLVLPSEYGPELTARLDALDAASDVHAAAQRPANTTRSYAADWRTWCEFAAQFGVPDTAAVRVGVLRAYVTWLWEHQNRAATTIDRKLAGLAVTLRRDHQVVIPPEVTTAARELLKDLKRQAAERKEPARGRGKAPAMRLDALRAIAAACPDTLTGLRDRAAVLLAFSIAARRHEAAALMGRDLVLVDGEGLDVDVRVSKTHPRKVAVPYGSDPALCPVRAWLAWQEAAGITPDSPALRRMHRTGSVTRAGLAPASVGALITEAGSRAGVKVRFTGHSVRSGLITEARHAGKDRKAIAAVSGHVDGSPVLDGYIQTADRWSDEDNALKGVL